MIGFSLHCGNPRPFIGHRRVRGLWALGALSLLLSLPVLGGCEAGQPPPQGPPVVAITNVAQASHKPKASHMWMTIGERRFAITLTDNEAARAFAAQLPLTLEMSEHNGNEKYADLPKALPTNANRPGTIRKGDLMLFGTNTLVVFYATFNSSYAYTRLGRVDDPDSLDQALGRRGVQVVFSND